jgi:hypothetical protein
MSMHRFLTMFSAWLIIAAIVGQVASAQPPAEIDLTQEAGRLAAVWKRQRGEIRTARIKAEYYFERQSHSDAHIQSVIDALAKTDEEIGRLDLFTIVTRHLYPARQPHWHELTLTVDGPRRRAHSIWRGPNQTANTIDAAYDGRNEVWHNSHSTQANVYPGRSPLRLPELSWFRTVPPPDLKWTLALDEKDASLVRSTAPVAMSIDRATGLVRHAKLGNCDIWQIGAREHGRGICFPQVVVRHVSEPMAGRLEIVKISSVEFNERLPADAFDVPLAAGTSLVDLRGGEEHRRATRMPIQVGSALAAADQAARENSGCHAAHELPVPHQITPCSLDGTICRAHTPGVHMYGILNWHDATCQNPNCTVAYDRPSRSSPVARYANMYRWICEVEFGEQGLHCRQLLEYLPEFKTRALVKSCQPAAGKPADH